MALRKVLIRGFGVTGRTTDLISTTSTFSVGSITCSASRKPSKQHARCYSAGSRESVWVSVNGVSFHCEKTGTGNHIVLLLPGALGSSKTDFDPQLEKLNKSKYTMLSFDPRGYGKSIPPERDWPLEFYKRDALDAVAVMKKLQYSKFSILGWSDGGITGLIIASQFPDIPLKLVVWGCNAFLSEEDMRKIKVVEDIDKWSPRMRQPFVELYGEPYFRTQWRSWVEAYQAIGREGNGDICSKEIKNIKCPTFIVHGDLDPMLDPVHPDFLHKHILGSRLHRMPAGKHNIHIRYQDEFNKLVEEFLDE